MSTLPSVKPSRSAQNKDTMIRSTSQTYNPMDDILRFMVGETPNVSNSWPGSYGNGKPSLENLQAAQERKMEEYFRRLNLSEGKTVLEIGPGWGQFLTYCEDRGVNTVSIVPAQGQYDYLNERGFEVYQGIWQDILRDTLIPSGVKFDAIVMMGSPEHFCSPEDALAGNQELIYQRLFEYTHQLLNPGGRIGGQFMHFEGHHVDYQKVSLWAKRGSQYYHYALLKAFYPSAWIPRDFYHFFYHSSGDDYFDVVDTIDGRLHYVWTMTAWGDRFRELYHIGNWRKIRDELWGMRTDAKLREKWSPLLKLLFKSFTNWNFFLWSRAFWEKSNRTCFEKKWMGHTFFFLQKK